jgi:hypothetical protein
MVAEVAHERRSGGLDRRGLIYVALDAGTEDLCTRLEIATSLNQSRSEKPVARVQA